MSESGKIWYKLRGRLIVPFYLFVILFDQDHLRSHWEIWLAGSLLFATGWILRIWSQMHLHYRLKTHKKLTITGPYVFVRNPIYIANTLILAGFTVLSGPLWFVPVMIIACGFTYHMTVLYEEEHLKNKYGQPYMDFLNRTPRWVPHFTKLESEYFPGARSFFLQSVLAELHIFALLIPLFLT